MSKFIFVAEIAVPSDKEELFNDIYDREHLPSMMKVPGVLTGQRYKLEWALGEMVPYLAIYEVENADVPRSEAWKIAGEYGAWKTEIRPFLTERRFGMYRAMD